MFAMTGPAGAASAMATAPAAARGPAHRDRRLGHRPAQRRLVDPLVADPAGVGGRDRVRDHQHGQPVERRVRDAVDRAGQPRPPGDDHGPGDAGKVRAGGGHDRRGRLAVGQHEAEPGRLRRPDHVQVGAAARHAEHQPGARLDQRRHDRFGRRRAVLDSNEAPCLSVSFCGAPYAVKPYTHSFGHVPSVSPSAPESRAPRVSPAHPATRPRSPPALHSPTFSPRTGHPSRVRHFRHSSPAPWHRMSFRP